MSEREHFRAETPEYRFEVGYKMATLASPEHPERNEDAMVLIPEKRVFGVLDGVSGRGGNNGGDRASSFVKMFLNRRAEDLSVLLGPEETGAKLSDLLIQADKELASGVVALPGAPARLPVFGSQERTTAALAAFRETPEGMKLITAHVGNTRILRYRLSAGVLDHLTLDHRFIPQDVGIGDGEEERLEMQKRLAGIERFEDIRDPADPLSILFLTKSMLDQSLGSGRVIPTVRIYDVKANDDILIISDGVHGTLSDRQIIDVVRKKSPDAAVALLEMATKENKREGNIRAGIDDMTAVVVSCKNKPVV